MRVAAHTPTQLEEIVMGMDRSVVDRIVNNALEERLSSIIGTVKERFSDELNGLASSVEDVIQDAISNADSASDPDSDEIESLKDNIVNDVLQELNSRKLIQDTPSPSIAERYKQHEIDLHDALHEAIGRSKLFHSEVEYLLKHLSENYEEQFALFLWRQSKRTA